MCVKNMAYHLKNNMTPTQHYRIMIALQHLLNALKEGTEITADHNAIYNRGDIFIREIIDVVGHVPLIVDKKGKKN